MPTLRGWGVPLSAVEGYRGEGGEGCGFAAYAARKILVQYDGATCADGTQKMQQPVCAEAHDWHEETIHAIICFPSTTGTDRNARFPV